MALSASDSGEAPLFDIQGTYEKLDFVAFSAHVLRPSVWSILRGAFMVVGALALVRIFTNSGADFRILFEGSIKQATPLLIYVYFFLFYIVLILAILLVNRLRLGRHFADQIGANKKSRLKFFEDRLETMTDTADAAIRWAGFRSYVEIRDYFFLMLGPRYAIIVPKRYLGDNSDIDGLRSLLDRHLARQH